MYKLTDKNMQTYGNFQWELGKWYEIPESDRGSGLCSKSYFHFYNHPRLAVLLNSIHANFDNPRLFEVEVEGDIVEDNGLKFGATKIRLIKEVDLANVTTEQRVTFAIKCALAVYGDRDFVNWANRWLSGEDRSANAADAAAAAARAAAAWAAAAWAAAWAAYAAAYAATADAGAAAAWAADAAAARADVRITKIDLVGIANSL